MLQIIAREYQISFRSMAKFKSLFGEFILDTQKSFLLLPQTFMNLSGVAVRSVAQYYEIVPEEILVVHDELDFAPGVVKLKFSGGANGHNGVQSVIDCMDSRDFWRLRIGIGKPVVKDSMVEYVLAVPRSEELAQINNAVVAVAAIIPKLMTGDFDRAITQLHS